MLRSKDTKLTTIQNDHLVSGEHPEGSNNIMTLPSQQNLEYNSLAQG